MLNRPWKIVVTQQKNTYKTKQTNKQTNRLIVWVPKSPYQLTDLSKYSSKGMWKGSQPAFLAFPIARILQKKSLAIGIDLWSDVVFSHCWLLVAAMTYYEAICLYLRYVLI